MNVQKFFNKKLRNPKSAYGLGKLFSKTKPYSSRIGRRIKETPTLKKLLSIHKKVKSIENLLGGIGKLDAKIIGVQDKAEKDKKKDKKKEGKKKNKFLGGIIKPPKTGFLDAIRNFVTYTFLGWLFTFLQPHLDKMQFILPVIQTAFDVMIFILKNILGGIGNTLKAFYFVKDNLTGAVDKIKEAASGIQKTFDDTLVALQDVVNGTIEVVNSFIESTGEKFDKVETVDSGTIPPLPEVPKFDDNTSSFSAPPTQPPNTLPSGISIQGAATGGRIDPSTPVTRGIQPEQRRDFRPLFKPSIQEQKSEPGKDVGGIDKVKDLYKSSTSGSGFSLGFFTISPTNEKDGFLALNKVSRELKINKSDDFLGLGNFMGASVDVALGQKPDKRTYQQFASGINYLVNYGINNPEAFQKMNLERMIETMVNSKVDVAINKIREEINKRSTTETPGTAPDGTTPGGGGGGGGGQLPGDAPPEVMAMLEAIAGAEGGWDSVNPDTIVPGLSNMTIAQARLAAIRKGIGEMGGSGAMGKFQQMPDYILDRAKKAGLNPEIDKFSPENQTKIARMVMASVYPGGESQLIKDAREDPLKASSKLRGTWPSLPGGTQENVHTSGFLSRYNKSLETYKTIQSTEIKANSFGLVNPTPRTSIRQNRGGYAADTGLDIIGRIGDPILSPVDGILEYAEEGHTIQSGQDSNPQKSGFQPQYSFRIRLARPFKYKGRTINFVYGTHLSDLHPGVRNKSGIRIEKGQLLGYMGQANGVPHLHIGFVEDRQQTKFLNFREVREILTAVETQENEPTPPENNTNPKRDQNNAPQQLTTQQQENIHNALMRKGQIPFKVGNESYYFVALADGSYRAYKNRNILGANVPEAIDITGSKNKPIQAAIRQTINKMYPLPSLSQPPKKKKGGLVYEQNNNPLFPPQTYASYNEPQMMAKVFIQPVIVEASKSSTPSGIMFPSINLNSSKSPKLIKQ